MSAKGLLTTAALLVATLTLVSFRPANAFTLANLNRPCIWSTAVFETTSGAATKLPAGPLTVLARITFNGKGGFTMDYDAAKNGTFSRHLSVPGTYSIDVNGHGTLNYISPTSGNAIGIDFYLSPFGDVIHTQYATYGTTVPEPRVGIGTCSFNE
jgi:hypothetical protein